MQTFDVIVAGVGSMGSQTCWQLARRGQRVLGLDRYDIPNVMGSSHGEHRIIRLAYFEHPLYVPILRRAYELWRELEQRAGEQILFVTGSMDIGPEGSPVIEGSLSSCREHHLHHELLSAGRGQPALSRLCAASGLCGRVPDGRRVRCGRARRHVGLEARHGKRRRHSRA